MLIHYAIIVAVLLVYYIFWQLYKQDPLEMQFFEPSSTAGIALQSMAILTTLTFIPLSLYFFKRSTTRLRELPTMEERIERYVPLATRRETIIMLPMLMSEVLYFILGGCKPMLWLLGICAIAWVFCKPSERQMQIDLEDSPYDNRD